MKKSVLNAITFCKLFATIARLTTRKYFFLLTCTFAISFGSKGGDLKSEFVPVIFNSAHSSVKFALKTLVPYKSNLSCKSSFVDQNGDVLESIKWHPFAMLEGPGWASNAVGGAFEIFSFGKYIKDSSMVNKSILLLDHVLNDGFINYNTGFITSYRNVESDSLYQNYEHNNKWFCVGSMAKIAYQLIRFGDLLDDQRKDKMYKIAVKTAAWIETNIKLAPNGWYPRRSKPDGELYPLQPNGAEDPLFEKSGDGLFVIQLQTALTKRGLADYTSRILEKTNLFVQMGGFFGSINHDTYDEQEGVAYSVAFLTLLEVSRLLNNEIIRRFAYEKCLKGLEQFKISEDRNGVQCAGLLIMEKSWDTAYLWENAEAAVAYLEAYHDSKDESFLKEALSILVAISKHHYGEYGFLTEGVDWNNHVGAQHHIGGAQFGDIKYTEPLLNNLHIVEPSLRAIKILEEKH